MRPYRGFSELVSGFFALMLVSTIFCTNARAELPADGLQRIEEASAKMDVIIRLAQEKGDMPRLSDTTGGRAALEYFWNADVFLGKPPYRSADLPLLLNIMERQTMVFKAYLLAKGSGESMPNIEVNTARYQDEIVLGQTVLLRTLAAALSAGGLFYDELPQEQRTDIRRQGVLQMRLGMQQMISGSAIMVRAPDLRKNNRLLLMRTLSTYAADIAGGLPAADREALVKILQTAEPALSAEGGRALGKFTSDMGSAPCKGLCRVE